ncbi:unnamed protein product [Urochloa humidicola]
MILCSATVAASRCADLLWSLLPAKASDPGGKPRGLRWRLGGSGTAPALLAARGELLSLSEPLPRYARVAAIPRRRRSDAARSGGIGRVMQCARQAAATSSDKSESPMARESQQLQPLAVPGGSG